MGNTLTPSGEQRVSPSSSFFKPKRRSQSPATFRHLMSPSSPSLQRQIKSPGSSHKHKRRSRSQSEGVTSDCGTAVSTTDSQLPRGSGVSCSSPRGMGVGHLSPEPLDPTEEEELSNKSSRSQDSTTDSSSIKKTSEHALDQAQRIREAEKILLEIAKEYAAKRAAGLVPTKPVPARTLLWEEMERRAQRVHYGIGRRGTCMFGRDSEDGPCGCTSYKKVKRLPDGRENTGGVCECCKHGAPWHRLTGGTMTVSGSGSVGVSVTRSSARSSMRSKGARSRANSRNSHTASRSGSAPQQAPIDASLYSLGSDYYDEYDHDYDYDSDEDSDEDDDDDDEEDIANEVARPYAMIDDPTPPLMHNHARSEGDRTSLLSNGDNLGLPPRLSSTSHHLDKLLGAIAKYRAMGMSEDEIEAKIREDFPPTERLSYGPRPTRASR